MKKIAILTCIMVIVALCGCENAYNISNVYSKLQDSSGVSAEDTEKSSNFVSSSASAGSKLENKNSSQTSSKQETTDKDKNGTTNNLIVIVPNVIGKTYQDAEKILSDLKFSVEKTEIFSDTYAEGIVVHQSIGQGESVIEGAKVTVSISKGPEVKVTVPNVTGYTLEDATQILKQSGLRIKTTIKCSNEVAEGYIISQNVAEGTQLSQDSYVEVFVSVGVANTVGNSISNSQQFGLVASQGDWIYYSNMNYDYNLYKMRQDGSQKQIVTKGCVVAINVVGEWIYYTDEGPSDRGLFKIKLDGTEKTKLSSGVYRWVYVVEDKIYYSSFNHSGKIYCMNTDGSGSKLICSDSCSGANVVGEWIYYINADTYDVYKIRTDGSERTRVHNSFKAHDLVYENGQLFANYNTDFQGISIDGTGFWYDYDQSKQKSFLNANNGWIYD